MMVVFLFSRLCHRKIGGATGDTLGASCELAETVLPFMLLPNFFL
jgi:cobalamin synthase